MLGLVLIYFIGKSFFELAQKNNKSEWGFAILGVISYYVGTFFAGIFIAIYCELFTEIYFEDIDTLVLSLIAIPFGVAACWGLYKFLEIQWNKEPKMQDNDILDDTFL